MNLASSGLVLVLARLVEVCVGVTRQVVVVGGGVHLFSYAAMVPLQPCIAGTIDCTCTVLTVLSSLSVSMHAI